MSIACVGYKRLSNIPNTFSLPLLPLNTLGVRNELPSILQKNCFFVQGQGVEMRPRFLPLNVPSMRALPPSHEARSSGTR